MSLTRRTLLSLPVAVPLLNLAARAAGGDDLYFPRPDAQGGWRTLTQPSEIRTLAGIDKSRLDEAFQYTQTTSQHGGLLVLRHGYLVYEKYFGRANRGSQSEHVFHCQDVYQRLLRHHAFGAPAADFVPDGLSQKIFTQEYLHRLFP